MKKYVIIPSILVLATVFLSGCSLVPTKKAAVLDPAAVKSSSILKSSDGGKSWEFKSQTAEKTSLDAVDVISLAINPYDSKNVLVGTLKNGLWKTDDAGENWKLLEFPTDKVYGLAIDPADSRIIYASAVWQGRGKIFKSIDSGSVWNEIYTAPSDGPLVISLSLDKKNSNIVYATTSDKQVIKSSDAGVSWKNIYEANSPVLKIVIDSVNSNLIYFNLLNGDIFKSKDGGKTIEEIAIKATSKGIGVIEVDPSNANWVYVAGQSGILRSKDAGGNWEEIKPLGNAKTSPVKTLAINPTNSQEIVYGASQAIYKSLDGGTNWIPFQLETAKNVSILKYSTEPGVVYLGLRKK